MKIRMLCALVFAVVIALCLLAAAGRSNDDPRNHESPGCKAVGDSPIADFFTAG